MPHLCTSGMDPNKLICKIPFSVLLKLSEFLDTGTNKRNWRGLIANIPEQIYTQTDIESFALEIHKFDGSPALTLLRDLGKQGRTIRQLISYLDKMSHEECLGLLKKPESIRLVQVPLSQTVQSGAQSVVILACSAKAFPYPHYAWFRAYAEEDHVKGQQIKMEEVAGAADRILKISPVGVSDSGAYCCKVYHTMEGKVRHVFTDWAYVTVYPSTDVDEDDLADVEQMQKPKIIQEPPVSLSVRPGKPIKVTCLATGSPSPTYQWYRYGFSSSQRSMEPHALRNQTDKTLYWAQSTLGDQGKYCCRIRNKAGCVTSTTVSITVDSGLGDSYPDKVEIVRHPQSASCRIGEQQVLACQAVVHQGTLFYQWFFNHKEIPGGTQAELLFLQVKPEDRGIYQCRVYNEYNSATSNEAMLDVVGGALPSPSNFAYFATDKVALLIGNGDYRSAEQLTAPKGDVETLAMALSNLDFKVVSLLNLSLSEMKFALCAFCDMLNSGVYGLFYFSGHGFEADGQSYLVPVDAQVGYAPNECICDQHILDQMQNRNTALNIILLDTCRKKNVYPQDKPAAKYAPEVKGNTIMGYAAQVNTQAYEVDGQSSGIFTKHLIERINQPKRISYILQDVIDDVRVDPYAKGQQIPSLNLDLNEARSLVDPINPAGHTQEINARSRMWGDAHLLPMSPIWIEFQHGLVVCIELVTLFSNVMQMHTYIPPYTLGLVTKCRCKLEQFSMDLMIRMEQEEVPFNYEGSTATINVPMTVTTVQKLQKLKGDLECMVKVEGEYLGKVFQESQPLVIAKPLVAKLWQTRHYAVPSEASYPDSTTST